MIRFLQILITRFLPLWIICCAYIGYTFPEWFTGIKNWTSFALAFILFIMGLTLSRDSLKRIMTHPKNAIIGVIGKWIVTTGISFFLACLFFSHQNDLKAGVILAGSVPSGTSANLYSMMANGNVALSVMMSSLDTFVSPFFTPVIMKAAVGSVVYVAITPLVLKMVYVVLLPISLGLLVQWKFQEKITAIRSFIPVLSSIALLIVDLSVVSNAHNMLHDNMNQLPKLFLCVFLQITIPMILGYLYSALFKMEEPERRSMVYEFGICNTALAALLAMVSISPIAAVPAVTNMIVNTSLGALIAILWEPAHSKWKNLFHSHRKNKLKVS
ncbi:bile acid:sodium symporter family protein [Bacillus sp. APMAM]|nr:bile acid:sodium symporter family protein [Bacillus sp. APMAM]RTZ54676.1 bile acid:sodium symporter family protein [Bacillus sp. SAJ1]